MRRLLTIALAALGLGLLASCGGDDDDSAGGAGGGAANRASAPDRGEKNAGGDGPRAEPPGIAIRTASSEFGEILFDGDEQAIYLFDKEATARSECYGACAEAWPPVLTEGEPRAERGVDRALLGTTERDDGTTQVTYNGHPLYYYVDDPPGQVLCHNVEEFGGLWLVVDPSGDAMQ